MFVKRQQQREGQLMFLASKLLRKCFGLMMTLTQKRHSGETTKHIVYPMCVSCFFFKKNNDLKQDIQLDYGILRLTTSLCLCLTITALYLSHINNFEK